MKRSVIGMTAHVDSGKTTLSEAMLYRSGEIRRQGRVDHGDAFLDTHPIERTRGITVFSKQAVMHLGESEFTLLDTPGHTDFSAETERALQALDYAVMVISGSEGVQSHTETLWRLLARYRIPTFIFINKMDISSFDRDYLMKELSSRLSDGCADFSPHRDRNSFLEEIALLDEDLMNSFLDSGEISDGEICTAVRERKVFPCYFGSALKLNGVDEFLNGLDKYTVQQNPGEEFGARIYKITDENGTRLTHMKITSGSLKVRSVINGEKVSRIRIYSGAKFRTADEAFAGTVCAAEGLSLTHAGQGVGTEQENLSPVLEPVMTYRMVLPADADAHTVLTQMRTLEEEDPQLHVIWNSRLQEIHVRLMGEIQLEILRTVISERFGLAVEFDRGSIVYKETISAPVTGAGHYEPLRHYAEVRLRLEPAETGSGLHFSSECREDDLDRNWQRLILSNLEEKAHLGVLTGSPITDIKIILTAGRAHLKHTEGGDFRQASWRAVRQGLRKAESVLLEPWYDVTLEVPPECTGRAMSDLQRMCGEFSAPESDGEMSVIKGSVPASEIMDYHSELMGYSHGKGRLLCVPKGYLPCHNTEEVIAKISYNCDEDTENSADSVFCSHGAGFLVKWNEVEGYMHTAAGSISTQEENEPEEDPERQREILRRQAENYRSRLAEDKELMEIFERTYGKIKRDERHALHTEKKAEPLPIPPDNLPVKGKTSHGSMGGSKMSLKQKPVPLQSGPEYLLVDGYNIIFSWDELKEIAKDNLDAARSRLINILCNYQGFRQCNLILVFDAYKVKGNVREVEKFHNISVVYTKEAETADMYIEKVTHELGKNHRVRVATSDGTEQIIILGNGAYRVSAEEFRKEVQQVENTIRKIIEG